MNIDEAISGRRSTRAYTTKAVEDDTIRRLIGAAVLAPSAVNAQPWLFVVVRDQALLDRISADAKVHMLATMPPGPHSDHLRSILSDADFHIFYHAPALVLIAARSQSPWAVEDCALAAENLMLAAHGEGLGTCWIGFAQSFLGTPEGKSALGLPAEVVPIAPIIVGYPKSTPPPVPRNSPEIRWIGQALSMTPPA